MQKLFSCKKTLTIAVTCINNKVGSKGQKYRTNYKILCHSTSIPNESTTILNAVQKLISVLFLAIKMWSIDHQIG